MNKDIAFDLYNVREVENTVWNIIIDYGLLFFFFVFVLCIITNSVNAQFTSDRQL